MTDALLLDATQVSALLSMGRRTFYNFLKTQQGQSFPAPIKLSYRIFRWRREDVEGWVKAQTVAVE